MEFFFFLNKVLSNRTNQDKGCWVFIIYLSKTSFGKFKTVDLKKKKKP